MPRIALQHIFSLFFVILTAQHVDACSMSKITYEGVTYVGNNEDSWHTDPRIWFEPGSDKQFGACYVGYADKWPQGGMNTAGLVYDAFTMYPSEVKANGKAVAQHLPEFLREIMRTCSTVTDVYQYASQFDRRNFNRAMMLFVDSTGAYLVMEADTMIVGNDAQFLLANFSFAHTKNTDDITLGRYRRGQSYLKTHGTGGLDFCRALMDTMSECRARIGDGTLYTSLYDTKRKLVHLCFYHDYNRVHTISLEAELAKGEHEIIMEDIFPKNQEFEKLKSYITPSTKTSLLPIMFLFILVLFIFSGAQATQWFRQLHLADSRLQYFRISIATFNALLGIYIWVIMNEPGVYYFPAPYVEPGGGWVNILSYLPIVLLIIMVGTLTLYFRNKIPFQKSGKYGFFFNFGIWLVISIALGYWGLYSII